MQMPVDHQMIWHPVKPELSSEEADELVYRSIIEHDGGAALMNRFDGIDLDNPEEIISALTKDHSFDSNTIIGIYDIKAWARLHELASALRASWKYGDYDEEPPMDDLEFGVASWFFEASSAVPVHLKMDKLQKKMFTELCKTADVISLEGTTKDNSASLALEFYS
jgi:hypothetical protein